MSTPKSLAQRKEDAINEQLDALQSFLWAFKTLSADELDGLLRGDADVKNKYFGKGQFAPFWKLFPKRFAKGTTWGTFTALQDEIEDLIAMGDELDAGSSPDEIFAFLSGGSLRGTVLEGVGEYSGAEFEGAFLKSFQEYIEADPWASVDESNIPDETDQLIEEPTESPNTVDTSPNMADSISVLPPEGPLEQQPTPDAPAITEPVFGGHTNIGPQPPAVPGGGTIPGDGDAPAPGKSNGFVTYLQQQIRNDFFKQPGWEITRDINGNSIPSVSLGDYLDANPGIDESYFLELVRQTKNWETFRLNEAKLWGQTEAEEKRTLENNINKVKKKLANFGVNLDEVDEAIIHQLARDTYIMGWDDDEIEAAIYNNAELAITNMGKGDHASMYDQVKAKARNYMLEIDEQTLHNYAQQIITGQATLSGISAGFARLARDTYPQLGTIMDQGFLPENYFSGYEAKASSLLERPVEFFGKDRGMFDVISQGVSDPDTGFRQMTIPEAAVYVRSLPEWENTKNARQSGRAVVESILKKWGAVGRSV